MEAKVLLLIGLVCQLATAEHITADYIENVRNSGSRIVSGWKAAPGQFPYQIALRMKDGLGRMFGCGASAVHKDWVMSAAHCSARSSSITVLGGMTNANHPEYMSETWEWYNHPLFNVDRPGLAQPNDISIIKLTTPLVYSANLQRVQLQPSSDATRQYTGERLIATGWGQTSTGGPTSEDLMWVYLVGISYARCAMSFGALADITSVCALGYNLTSQSICLGDSGGPLVEVGRQGQYIQIGISSFVAGAASGGCEAGHPSGFTRPGPYHTWLTEITGIDFENINEETSQINPALQKK